MGLGYANEDSRFHLSDAAQQIPVSHTWIDQDDNSPDLEERKGERNKLQGWFDHQHDPVISLNPKPGQTAGKEVSSIVHRPECPRSENPAGPAYQTGSVRIGLGCIRECLSNVVVHCTICFWKKAVIKGTIASKASSST